jgi:hypothetical protein
LKAFSQRIHDVGLDRFIRKLRPEVEISASVAIVKGLHEGHVTAVYCTHGKLRCLSLDTTYGLSDDEAIWPTFASWACFQPRRLQPRETPGRLFYPSVYSHAFEKYEDYLPNFAEHPDFVSETPFRQECMKRFSRALSPMDLSGFQSLTTRTPLPWYRPKPSISKS